MEQIHGKETYLQQWLNYLLPPHCLLCGLFCGSGRLCQGCSKNIPRIYSPCRTCALPGVNSEIQVCGACLRQAPPWDEARAGLLYEYPVDQIVQRFKFRRNLVCGRVLADELLMRFQNQGVTLPDVIVPVPLHFSRFFKRGFNQAEFIARQVGKFFDVPVRINLLRRSRRTAAQSELDYASRLKNVRGAFSCKALGGLSVALVDDVMTTGTTLRACAKTVKRAGANQVSVWVAARVPTPI
jgi:ComF family protein